MGDPGFERHGLRTRVIVPNGDPTARTDEFLFDVVDLGDIWIVIDVLTSLFKGDPVLLEDDICWGYELVRTLQ